MPLSMPPGGSPPEMGMPAGRPGVPQASAGPQVNDSAVTAELNSKIAMMPPQAKQLLLKVIDRIMAGPASGTATTSLQSEISKRGGGA